MNKSSFVIDKIRRVLFFDGADDAVLFNLTQIEDVSMNATVDNNEVLDAMQNVIMTIEKAKNMEIAGNASFFDMALLGAQWGSGVEDSSATVKFAVPCFETYTYKADATTHELKHEIATGSLGTGIAKYAYKLNKDGSIAKKYEYVADTATADKFSMATTDNKTTFTPPTGSQDGDMFLIAYEYEANETNKASRVVDNAEVSAKSGRLMIECLFRDICNKEIMYYGYAVCDNAQVDGNVDVSLTTDGKHPFTIKAMPAYCAEEKNLLTFVIPDVA